MAWQDFEDTTQRSRRPQLTRNVGGTTTPRPTTPPREGFIDKAKQVVGQTAGLGVSGVKAVGGFIKNSAVDIFNDAVTAGKALYEPVILTEKLRQFNYDSGVLNDRQERIIQDYKSGKLSKDDYLLQLKEVADSRRALKQDVAPALEKNPIDYAEGLYSTAFNVASVGSISLAKAGAKEVAEAGGKETIDLFLQKGSNKIEDALLRVPAFKTLVARNLQADLKIMGSESLSKAVAREGKKVAFGLLIKRPLFYQANIEDARNVLAGVLEGDAPKALKSAAWLGIQMLDGGPLGAAGKGYKLLTGKAKTLAYGQGSAIDALSRRFGSRSASQLADLLVETKNLSKEAGKEVEDVLRILQNQQEKLFPNDVDGWADNLASNFIDADSMTAKDFVANLINWRQADILGQSEMQKLVKAGKLTAEEAAAYTPVRWTQQARDALAKRIGTEMDVQKQLDILNRYADRYGFGNNQELMQRLEYEINRNMGGSGDIAKAIREIDAVSLADKAKGVTKSVEKKLAKMGYIYAKPLGGRKIPFIEDANTLPKLVSESAEGAVDLFDPAVAPQPELAYVKNLLNKTGLSPEASQRAGQVKLTEAVATKLADTNIDYSYTTGKNTLHGSKAILTRLQNYVEHMKPNKLGRFVTAGAADKAAVTDLRQLTKNEIIEALSSKGNRITKSEARAIQQAINDGYLEMPLALRGIGPKAVDYLYKYNPVQGAYSRVQSALRYTYNPFFRVQESVETSLLSASQGANRFKNLVAHNGIWNQSRAELDSVVKQLEDAQVFSSSLYGEAAQDQVLGRITANLTQGQKRDLAGLALDVANKQGTTVEALLRDAPDQIEDALRIIVQYPKDGILASPLARTMNVAFFPIRYNTKVTMLAAKTLAKQPPVIQKAALHGLFQMSSWLKSDEGIAWQAEYADALGVLKWVTPIGSIESALSLLNGSVDAPGDLGLLGGLPLGVVTQMLDSQGIIDLNTPYVNPETGDTIPRYIPQTVQARAATALTDILGSTFTYPGRTLGLPGKSENLRKAVRTFIDNGYDDYLVIPEDGKLTQLQRNMVRVLKGDTSEEALEAVFNSATPDSFQGFVVPPYQIEELFQVKRRENLPRRSSSSRARRPRPTARPIPTSQQ